MKRCEKENGKEDMNKIWNKFDKIFILELMSIGGMLLPILMLSFYALPAADDFSNAGRMAALLTEESSYLKIVLYEVWRYYKTTSGYFFGVFLNLFLSPFLRGGINVLRGTVFVINLFFYTSLYFFVEGLQNFFFEKVKKRGKLLIYIIVLFAFTNNYNNIETWTWYCVLIGYIFVVACMFWGILFFLKALQSDKLSHLIVASMLGFLVSGASLNVTAMNCGLYLIIGILGFQVYHKKKVPIICVSSALAGGIINAMAPGNFQRHDSVTSSYYIIGSLKASTELVISRVQTLLVYTPFLLLLVVFFFFSLKNINKFKNKWKIHPIIILLLVFAGVVIVNFPVCLGYTTDMLPERCIWVEDCAIYIGMFGWSAYFAGWLKGKIQKLEIHKELWLCIALSSLYFICSLGSVRGIESYPTIGMARQLFNGEIAEYAAYWEDILAEIETSDNSDVIVRRDYMKTNSFILSPRIVSGDKSNWVNRAIASYYGKKSVDIICTN